MPLTTLESGLLTSGAVAVGFATYFYKKKKTVPFKVISYRASLWEVTRWCLTVTRHLRLTPLQTAYMAAWPLLGEMPKVSAKQLAFQ